MTGVIDLFSSGPNPLSRLTVATLEDLGYTVDYDTAEDFGVDDLNLSVCPLCSDTAQQLKTVASRQLGVDQGEEKRRQLADDLRMEAVRYGLKLLESNSEGALESDDLHMNCQWISVIVVDPEDESNAYSIIVVADI